MTNNRNRSRKRPSANTVKNQPRSAVASVAPSGSVRVAVPIAQGVVMRNLTPKINVPSEGAIQVTHCEPFFTVVSLAAGAFSTARQAIIPTAFPWLQGLAYCFSTWRFSKISKSRREAPPSLCGLDPKVRKAFTDPLCLAQFVSNQTPPACFRGAR